MYMSRYQWMGFQNHRYNSHQACNYRARRCAVIWFDDINSIEYVASSRLAKNEARFVLCKSLSSRCPLVLYWRSWFLSPHLIQNFRIWLSHPIWRNAEAEKIDIQSPIKVNKLYGYFSKILTRDGKLISLPLLLQLPPHQTYNSTGSAFFFFGSSSTIFFFGISL